MDARCRSLMEVLSEVEEFRAAAGRYYAAHPWDALALIGLCSDN